MSLTKQKFLLHQENKTNKQASGVTSSLLELLVAAKKQAGAELCQAQTSLSLLMVS